MTGVAPEPAERAVARVLAGGLDDTREDIARDLMRLLDRADANNTAIVPYPDGETAFYSVEPLDGHGSDHIVRYDTSRRAWGYST